MYGIHKQVRLCIVQAMLPWIVRPMNEHDRREFYTEIPFPLRFLLKKSWLPTYLKTHVADIHAIIDDNT